MKKYVSTILILLFLTTIKAQNKIETILHNNNWPSQENISIHIEDDLLNKTYIPITIIKGKKQGPVFTMVAGVHGFEYPPIVAVQELLQEIDKEHLTGTLIIIPIANIAAFYNRTMFLNPLDKINLNRAFPGSKNGTVTQKIAHVITSDIIAKSDVFLDIHGGDANEDLLPFVCYYNNKQKQEQTDKAKRLSEVSGFKYVVSYGYTLKDDKPAKFVFKQAVQDGKIALSIESGKLGNVQNDAVKLIKKGVYNMLSEMKMYKNSIKTDHGIVRINKQNYIKATEKGIFYSDYKAGDFVKEGDIIGYTKDEFGKIISDIKAQHSGVIMYKIGTPPVNIGDTIMCIGYRL